MDDVRLPELQVIRRFSIALRKEYAPADEVIEALRADLEKIAGRAPRLAKPVEQAAGPRTEARSKPAPRADQPASLPERAKPQRAAPAPRRATPVRKPARAKPARATAKRGTTKKPARGTTKKPARSSKKASRRR